MSDIVDIEINRKNRWIYFTRNRWVAHVIYWTWVFIAGTLMMVKVPLTPGVIINHFILENLLIALFYYVYCLFLIPYYFKRNRSLMFWLLVIISYLLITALDVWFNSNFVIAYIKSPLTQNSGFLVKYVYNLGGYLLNFMVFSIMLFFMEKNEESHTMVELENEKKEIEQVKLDLLKTNISPDFLMRSLKQIKESAVHNDEVTPESILSFSELLRYRLYWGRQQLTPLTEELQHLTKFVYFITLSHFKNNLNIVLNIQGYPLDKKIAPLSLINILELFCEVNPVDLVDLDLKIHIETDRLDLTMEYHAMAPEKLMSDLEKYGTNYQQLFGSSVRLHFENGPGQRCKIHLSLPLQTDTGHFTS